MTTLDRMKRRLQRLRARQRELSLNGKLCTASAMEGDIRDLEAQIAALEPRPLREYIDRDTLRRLGLHRKIIELHLAADYLADCGADYASTLATLGLNDVALMPQVKEIQRLAQHLANHLCEINIPALGEFMTGNDDYINSLHGFSTAYINSKVALTNE